MVKKIAFEIGKAVLIVGAIRIGEVMVPEIIEDFAECTSMARI